MATPLMLPEEVLLLIYDNPSGEPLQNDTYRPKSVSGAAIMDLVINGALVPVEEDGLLGAKQVLRVADGPRPNNPVMQEILAACDGKKIERSFPAVAGVTSFKKLSPRLFHSLVEQFLANGVLRPNADPAEAAQTNPDTDPPGFDSSRAAAVDEQLMGEIRQRLNATIANEVVPELRTVALLSALEAGGLLRHVFPDWEPADLRERYQAILQSDWAPQPVKDVLHDIELVVRGTVVSSALPGAALKGSHGGGSPKERWHFPG